MTGLGLRAANSPGGACPARSDSDTASEDGKSGTSVGAGSPRNEWKLPRDFGRIVAVCQPESIGDVVAASTQVKQITKDQIEVEAPLNCDINDLAAKVFAPDADIESLGDQIQIFEDEAEGRDLVAFSASEALSWSAVLGKACPPGFFGENLRVAGPVDDLEIGGRLRIGATVELEVTGPNPLDYVLQHDTGLEDWQEMFCSRKRVGICLRVIVGGIVNAGDSMVLIRQLGHEISGHRWFAKSDRLDARTLVKAEGVGKMVLAGYMRESVVSAAGYRI